MRFWVREAKTRPPRNHSGKTHPVLSRKAVWLAVSLTLVRVRPRGWRVGPSGWHLRLRQGLAPSHVGRRPCNAACTCQNGLCAGAGCARGGALPPPRRVQAAPAPPERPHPVPTPCLPVPSQRPAELLRPSGRSRPSTAASSCLTGRPAWCWSGRGSPSRTCWPGSASGTASTGLPWTSSWWAGTRYGCGTSGPSPGGACPVGILLVGSQPARICPPHPRAPCRLCRSPIREPGRAVHSPCGLRSRAVLPAAVLPAAVLPAVGSPRLCARPPLTSLLVSSMCLKPLVLHQDSSILESRDLRLEKRTLFR